jgi:hypothetical protein
MEILLIGIVVVGSVVVTAILRRVAARASGEAIEARLAKYAGPGRW